MREIWSRLGELAAAAGVGSMRWNPPSTPSTLDRAEAVMGLTLPADYRETLLIADGQDQSAGQPPQWMPGCAALRPIADVLERWSYEAELTADDPEPTASEDSRFMWTVVHPRRIPIAGSPYWDGDNTYLDLIPGPTGTAGQVLTFTSEVDMEIVGGSLRSALEKVIRVVEAGGLTWDPQSGQLVPVDGLTGHPAEWFAALG